MESTSRRADFWQDQRSYPNESVPVKPTLSSKFLSVRPHRTPTQANGKRDSDLLLHIIPDEASLIFSNLGEYFFHSGIPPPFLFRKGYPRGVYFFVVLLRVFVVQVRFFQKFFLLSWLSFLWCFYGCLSFSSM